MTAVLLDAMPRLPMTLGRHAALVGSATHANSKWSSSLPPTLASGSALKKHRSGSALSEALPKVILSKEAAAAAKEALRRQQSASITAPANAEKVENKTIDAYNATASDPAWGIFKSREDFLEMHIC